MNNCKKHPKYQAIKQPKYDCIDCWKLFCQKNPDKVPVNNRFNNYSNG